MWTNDVASSNGRAAMLESCKRYNRQGKVSKRAELANQRMKTLHYKNETSFLLEAYVMVFKSCSDNLDKAIQYMTQYMKVGRILDGININNNELLAAKSLV